ncbi:hypothetical protein MIR68_003249 [Amoeboaphelidium protococcarum]|nr:hypothetical protein MIR68_003249 [Amoeboaphelidium protococcarum]
MNQSGQQQLSEKEQDLVRQSLEAKEHSYSPYSKFRVGAALLTDGSERDGGLIFSGCNVENAAYGETICAERTAMVKAVSHGHRRFTAIAISSDLDEGREILPCGSCRQVLAEFCYSNPSPFRVISVQSESRYKVYLLTDLLPKAFTPADLIN